MTSYMPKSQRQQCAELALALSDYQPLMNPTQVICDRRIVDEVVAQLRSFSEGQAHGQ
jgi:hypothetical protein